jgi:hypothetical protein
MEDAANIAPHFSGPTKRGNCAKQSAGPTALNARIAGVIGEAFRLTADLES